MHRRNTHKSAKQGTPAKGAGFPPLQGPNLAGFAPVKSGLISLYMMK